MSVIDNLLGLLVPHECLGCGSEGSLLCGPCAATISSPPPNTSNLLKVSSVAVYEGLAKDLVWKLKSGGAQAAAASMARLMTPLITGRDYWLVPVPTATTRARQRGYDQANILAKRLSRMSGLPRVNCLRRLGQSHQVGSSRRQRLLQLDRALVVNKSVKGSKIILIDDVTTTGATLETAAKTLLKAGAQSVEALTFAYKP